jgi:hypothetical protein
MKGNGWRDFALIVTACAAVAALVLVITMRSPAAVRTITPGPVVTRTVHAKPRVVIRYRARKRQHAADLAPNPTPSCAQWVDATATTPGHCSAAYVMPSGVKAGPEPGTYYVDCFETQCTSLPGAGPDGTTCSEPHTGMQLCSP